MEPGIQQNAKTATEVLASALWGTHLNVDVRTIAIEVAEELDRMGYTVIKKDVLTRMTTCR